MIIANIQHRIFLLTVLLYFWISQVYSYDQIKEFDECIFYISCNENEHLESSKLIEESKTNIKGTKPDSVLTIFDCPVPNKPYLETLKKININASRVDTMTLVKMADTYLLNDSLFEGMPLKNLHIKGNHYVYSVLVEPSGMYVRNGEHLKNVAYSDLKLSNSILLILSRGTAKIYVFTGCDTVAGFSGKGKKTAFEAWSAFPDSTIGFEKINIRKLDLTKASSYSLNCYDGDLLSKKPLFPNILLNVLNLKFKGCAPPNVPYSDILRQLNINSSSVKHLWLTIIPSDLLLKSDHFKGLSIHNMLTIQYETIQKLDFKVFQEIAADEVYLKQVQLLTLKEFRGKKLTLDEVEFVGNWGNCSTLTSLILKNLEVYLIPDGWLRKCRYLTDLTISLNSQKGMEKMLKGAHALINLSIFNVFIRVLENPFAEDAVNLRKLRFFAPMMTLISVNAFVSLKKLEELEIQKTELSSYDILQAIIPLESLRKLTIYSNTFSCFCDANAQYALGKPRERNTIQRVESLTVHHSGLTEICFNEWSNLTYLDLRFNKISELNILYLPVPREHSLTVDLRRNNLNRLSHYIFGDLASMEKYFNKSHNITILLDGKVECDCEYSWTLIGLRRLPQISLQNTTCSSGESLVDFTGDKFRCDKDTCGSCTCRTSWDDKKSVADCDSRKLHTLPAIWNGKYKKVFVVKKIVVSNNLIETLPAYEYPETLNEVDLSNNRISHLSESALNALFLGGERQVHLSGNRFVCDCDTQPMINALRMYKDLIPDYKFLNCSNQNLYIYELSDRSLCLEQSLFILGIFTASLLALAAVMTTLYFRNKLTIKAFLYARGLCLYCVTEDDLDADKEYDAFISFAGLDDELVSEELLPGLENDYKLCVHTRNWIPGEMIYTQIDKSVEKSRRTVIVLTKNFVNSVWGIVEFRTAYIKALREGRVRVICILVDDDINDIDLPTDLKVYLKSNTYLKLRDPWFWQKLRYALPHPSFTNRSGLPNENEENRYQEIELDYM